jgi:autotransporter translocation and assembly factor TamB
MEAKKRRIRLHKGLTFAAAVVVSIVIAVIVFLRSGLLAYQLSQYVNEHYFKDTPFQFSCGAVRSDLVSHASISDLVIRYQDAERSVKIISADEITVDYDLVEALSLKLIIRQLDLEKVRISLWYDSKGKPIMPAPRGAIGVTGEKVSPYVDVRRFAVRDLQFMVEKENAGRSVKEVDLSGSARYADGKGEIDIDQGRAYLADRGRTVSSIRAALKFEKGRLSANDVVVRLEQSLVMLSGSYENGRFDRVQAVFNPLSLDEVSDLGWIPKEKGELGGSVVVSGARDSLAVEGSLTGRALGLVFSGLSLRGLVTPQSVRLSALEGEVHGARLNGAVFYDRLTGSYTFDGSCERLDLAEGFIPGGGTPVTDLNGRIHLVHDGTAKTFDVRADLGKSVISGFEASNADFVGRWSDRKGLEIRSVTISRPGFALAGFGTIDKENRADLVLSAGGNQLDYVTDYLLVPRLGGSADLTAKLTGPIDGFQVNANGSWRDLAYLSARIDSSAVHADARRVRSPQASATVNVDGRRLYLGGMEFTAPHVLLEVDGKSVEVRDFSFARGDTAVTTDFQVETGKAWTPILVKHVAVRTPRTTWKTASPARVTVRGSSTIVDTLLLESGEGEVGVSGRFSTTSDGTDLHVWGKHVDMGIFREITRGKVQLTGTGQLDAVLLGKLDDPAVSLKMDVANGTAGDVRFEHLFLDGEFAAGGYRLNRLSAENGTDSITATGWWECPRSPVALARSGTDVDAVWESAISVEALIRRFPITSFVRKVYKNSAWEGSFSGRLAIGRTLADPRIELAGAATTAKTSGFALPDVRADIVYDGGRLNIHQLATGEGSNQTSLVGFLPVALDLRGGKGFQFDRDGPVEFEADIALGDLSIIAGRIDAVAAAAGKLSGRLDIGGTFARPRFDGELYLRDTAFRLSGSDEVFRELRADVTVRENRVTLASLHARKEKKGEITATGSAVLEGFGVSEYAVDVTLSELPLSLMAGFRSVQSGKIRITTRANEEGGRVPFLTGSLDVKEAVITRSLATQEGPPSPLTMPTESPTWLCDLEIKSPKNVWVRNPEVNMELGGDLILKRDQKGFYFRGDLNVIRGSYTLYNNKFRITSGRFDFATATTLRPGIYLDAYTPYRRAGEVEHQIYLSLSWPPDEQEPKITLTYSEPGYSESDIWAMLGGQVVTGGAAFAEGETWNPSGTATSLASNYLERILNAQMSNMTIAVESTPVGEPGRTGDRESEMSIAIGRYLSQDLYFNYRQGLRVSSVREIDVEYRLSNLLLLRSEIIQNSEKGIQGASRQTADEINFDLKFRWEY